MLMKFPNQWMKKKNGHWSLASCQHWFQATLQNGFILHLQSNWFSGIWSCQERLSILQARRESQTRHANQFKEKLKRWGRGSRRRFESVIDLLEGAILSRNDILDEIGNMSHNLIVVARFDLGWFCGWRWLHKVRKGIWLERRCCSPIQPRSWGFQLMKTGMRFKEKINFP